MMRAKSLRADENPRAESPADFAEKLILIDDSHFVGAFADAVRRRGGDLVCVRCEISQRPLGALVLLLDEAEGGRECAGSVGFCCDCYRDLTSLMRHRAILRAAKST